MIWNLRTKIRWLDDLEDMVTPDISDPSRRTEITPLRRTDEDEHHNFSVREGENNQRTNEETTSPERWTTMYDESTSEGEPLAEIDTNEGETNVHTNSRTKRTRRPTSKLMNDENRHMTSLRQAVGYIINSLMGYSSTQQAYTSLKQNINNDIENQEQMSVMMHEDEELNVDGSVNYIHPMSFVAKSGKNDTFHFHDAMKQNDRGEFIKAMVRELEQHQRNKHWKLVPRSEIGEAKTVKAIWAFKRKRRPDGSILKHKARLNAHGGMQVYGETYWDTYAPVVNWISIRMMLTLAVIHNLYTTSIDFTLAFPQADVDTTIYMEVPTGCTAPEGDHVCLLKKNLYGLKQAAKTWYEYLRDTLILDEVEGGYGFEQSKIDPCIFFKRGVILIIWVDDCLIFGKNKKVVDEVIIKLHDKFSLTEEGDVSAYLGVKVNIDSDSDNITLTQPYLIQRIIEELGDAITKANVKSTPSVYKEVLHKDTDGPNRKQSWNYRSIIGMLNYLAASTRPDILFAVHQCARFSTNPKLSHERAVKRIVRYLKGTKDKGIILRPNPQEGIKCYVDADFAGGYSEDTKDDPMSVFSRTGYVIFYYGCPVLWVSKMQSEISLSTVEAEYIALSTSMRDLIPFVDQVKELEEVFGQKGEKVVLHCTLFEDNNGALELANAPRYRPRTKHIAIKYHHFRERVQNGTIKIKSIDTNEQIADQFTKGLQVGTFNYLRNKLLGW